MASPQRRGQQRPDFSPAGTSPTRPKPWADLGSAPSGEFQVKTDWARNPLPFHTLPEHEGGRKQEKGHCEPASPDGSSTTFRTRRSRAVARGPREDDGTSAERPALVRSEGPQKTSSSLTCGSVAR